MCGINGFNFVNKPLIKEMNKKIIHRGPDLQDFRLYSNVSLGSCRLKIIDLSENASMPMSNNSNTLSIVYNGEIYNFQELKVKYCSDYNFKSTGDTEVILAMYEKFGEQCVDFFNGMWAFTIYDKEKNQLFCSRDRLGIKPFYYYHKDDKFIFSSEIKAILSSANSFNINPGAISSFLRYRYVLEEDTFFSEIKKLMPGYNLVYNLDNNKTRIYQYWDLQQKEVIDSFENQKIIIKEELFSSVKYRMISDVPVGAILSCGLDSSLTSALMAKQSNNPINTYTVKFKEKGFDETGFAKLVAKKYNTNHNELLIEKKEFLEAMDKYLEYKDEPIGVPNEVALYLLFKKIKKTATVVLAGEGADEIFAGYGRIYRSPFDYLKLTMDDENIDFLEFFMKNYGYFTQEDLKEIIKDEYQVNYNNIFFDYLQNCPRDYYNKISYVFLKVHLPGLLLRSDVSSMASSIESRVPFLDHNLVQKAFSLPFEYKNKFKSIKDIKESLDKNYKEISEEHDVPKFILKEISKEYLPKKIIDRKKIGFPLPLDKWFSDSDKIKKVLLKKNKISKYVDMKKLTAWIENSKDSKLYGQKIWMLYSLEKWLEHILKNYTNVSG